MCIILSTLKTTDETKLIDSSGSLIQWLPGLSEDRSNEATVLDIDRDTEPRLVFLVVPSRLREGFFLG